MEPDSPLLGAGGSSALLFIQSLKRGLHDLLWLYPVFGPVPADLDQIRRCPCSQDRKPAPERRRASGQCVGAFHAGSGPRRLSDRWTNPQRPGWRIDHRAASCRAPFADWCRAHRRNGHSGAPASRAGTDQRGGHRASAPNPYHPRKNGPSPGSPKRTGVAGSDPPESCGTRSKSEARTKINICIKINTRGKIKAKHIGKERNTKT